MSVEGENMDIEESRAMLTEFYRIWSTGDVSRVDDLFAPDFVNHNSVSQSKDSGGARPLNRRDGFKEMVRIERIGFPDLIETPLYLVVEGEDAVGMYRTNGTHLGDFAGIPPTGRHIEFVGIDWLKIVDGKFTEWWYSSMTIPIWAAMGLKPVPTPFDN
jgi:predicted ester cyclase